MSDLPSGTVTLLFSDIEGSTRLLDELGPEGYRDALGEHRRLLRAAFGRHRGYEVDYQGDAFFVAFQDAVAAVEAAREAQAALADGPIGVRMGLHTGKPLLDPPKYVGRDVHLAARVMGAAHGGQVLLSKVTADLVEGQLSDLGEHRLKDFDEPVWLFQLGEQSFPPLKTISNTNLPRPASSFVGREQELAEAVSLVREGARLVTLTGPGGSGKTRLAIEAAAELAPEFRAGVFWVGLAALRDPRLISETVAQTLGAKQTLAEHIGERELLLLLDNLEQVVEAGPELAGLIEACPNLALLVTSRELLRVRGEVEYHVPPLAEPDAVELFCARAQAEPSSAVEELCRRLDNMPLALELAAARASVLTVEQIVDRLAQRLDLFKGGRDADPRQQTLRATIEWSHDLLAPEEQQLFSRLAVFTGGCTLEAAEIVADAGLDTLQSLVEKSLVRHTDGRFWMLETIREYAAEKLEQSGEAETLRSGHADYFVSLAEREKAGVGEDEVGALERIRADYDNSRAALAWLNGRGEGTAMLRLVCALDHRHFWFVCGLGSEGRRWLETALAHDDNAPLAVRAEALATASGMAQTHGDLGSAETLAEQSLSIARELDDPLLVAGALHHLGLCAAEDGDYVRAEELYEEARRLGNAAGGHFAGTLINLGVLAAIRGDYPRAVVVSSEAVALAGEVGQTAAQANALGNLALAQSHIDEAAALPFLRKSLELARDLGFHSNAGTSVFTLAFLLAPSNPARAAFLVAATDSLIREAGLTLDPLEQDRRQQALERAHARLNDEEFEHSYGEGQSSPADEVLEQALALLEEIEHA